MTASVSTPGKASPLWVGGHARVTLASPPGPLRAESVAEALAEGASRRVLAMCVESARSVKDISVAAGVPLATTYRQVHRLMDLGLLVVERSAMTPDGKKYDLYRSRVKEAHLDVTGGHEEVRWLANEAVEGRLIELWDAIRTQARE